MWWKCDRDMGNSGEGLGERDGDGSVWKRKRDRKWDMMKNGDRRKWKGRYLRERSEERWKQRKDPWKGRRSRKEKIRLVRGAVSLLQPCGVFDLAEDLNQRQQKHAGAVCFAPRHRSFLHELLCFSSLQPLYYSNVCLPCREHSAHSSSWATSSVMPQNSCNQLNFLRR